MSAAPPNKPPRIPPTNPDRWEWEPDDPEQRRVQRIFDRALDPLPWHLHPLVSAILRLFNGRGGPLCQDKGKLLWAIDCVRAAKDRDIHIALGAVRQIIGEVGALRS